MKYLGALIIITPAAGLIYATGGLSGVLAWAPIIGFLALFAAYNAIPR